MLFKGKYPVKEHVQESIHVKALKKQLTIMNQIVDSQGEQLTRQAKQIASYSEQSSQDKLLDMVGKFFLGDKSNIANDPNQPSLISETGRPIEQNLSDDQIAKIINQYQPNTLKGMLVLGEDKLSSKIKEHYPSLSDSDIKKGIEMVKNL